MKHIRRYSISLAIGLLTTISAQAALLFQEDFDNSIDSAGFYTFNSNVTPGFTTTSPQVTQGTHAYFGSDINNNAYVTLLRITSTGATGLGAGPVAGVSQSFKDAFVVGSTVTFDVVYTGLTGVSYINVQFARFDEDDSAFFVLAESPYNNFSNVHTVSYTVTAGEAARFANSSEYKLEFFLNNGSNQGTFPAGQVSIDNFQINGTAPIPEPSSFAALAGLAALVGVGLRRRRA